MQRIQGLSQRGICVDLFLQDGAIKKKKGKRNKGLSITLPFRLNPSICPRSALRNNWQPGRHRAQQEGTGTSVEKELPYTLTKRQKTKPAAKNNLAQNESRHYLFKPSPIKMVILQLKI